jgi:hypothetical protein
MSDFVDKLASVRGLPVLVGVALAILNLVVRVIGYALIDNSQEIGFVVFLLTEGNLLLHVGVVTGLLGILIGDIL